MVSLLATALPPHRYGVRVAAARARDSQGGDSRAVNFATGPLARRARAAYCGHTREAAGPWLGQCDITTRRLTGPRSERAPPGLAPGSALRCSVRRARSRSGVR